MALLHLELLGDFRLRTESGSLITISARKSQAMLAYLAVKPSQLVSRDKMAALLWSSTAPEQARQSLRQTLSTMRRELAAVSPQKILVEEGDFLSLDASLVYCDVAEFESLVTTGTAEALDPATRLYAGDFLDGFLIDEEKFDQWVLAERDRLHRMALRAHAQLVEQLTRSGSTDEAIAIAQQSLRIDPLQESMHRTLMRLYLQSGDLLNALQQYDGCAKLLRRELDLEPDAETRALQQEIVELRKRRHTPQAAEQRDARKNVLVVEDNLLNRELTNAVLKAAGYNVILAKDGAEALMLMGREHVDLMLLDVDLPFIDGHKVLEALHEKGIAVPTIFISGLPGEEPELRAFNIGAADFIRKPVKNSVLLARVSKVLKA
ncbi:MAG TPA: BTAD domain-containing putative transcriptional regulator [Thermoanaerobaculia bacterium]|jgi:DNA-binding SARP family transcriptional activator|nr:BTAD domain-containing putative transcriptional regulator [Thermoanaerobaculia bacterium]